MRPNGLECIVSCDHQVIENPPSPGSVLTVKHSGYWSSRKLKYPSYWRKRLDVNWETVLAQYKEDLYHKKELVAKVGKSIGVQEMEDWYNVSEEDIGPLASLLRIEYGGSLIEALKHFYPHYQWLPWRFIRLKGEMDTLRAFVEFISNRFYIKDLDGWYRISLQQQIGKVISREFVKKHGGLYHILQTVYPQHNWQMEKLAGSLVMKNGSHLDDLQTSIEELRATNC